MASQIAAKTSQRLAAGELSAVTKAMIRRNLGGRNSNNGLTVTVFGATGFLGRYVCAELGAIGTTLQIPYRGEELEVRHLRPMSDLGMQATHTFSPRDQESIMQAVRGSDVVVNLMGKDYETKHALPWWINYTYDQVNVDAAAAVAQACVDADVPRLLHVSSVLAKPNSPSTWAASKYRGERAVKKIMPDATIVRSARMYGPEDRFLNTIADSPLPGGVVPLIDGGEAKVQPVYAVDVATALRNLVLDEDKKDLTYELYGDETYTMKECAEFVFEATKKNDVDVLNLPLGVAKIIGKVMNNFPEPKFNEDIAIRETLDQVAPALTEEELLEVSEADARRVRYPGLRELDVEPAKMEQAAIDHLLMYYSAGHFSEVDGYH